MTYAHYARRTCVCGHDISEHLLIKGSCKKCHLAPKTEDCIQFTSMDGFSAHRAQVWGRRLRSRVWLAKALVAVVAYSVGMVIWYQRGDGDGFFSGLILIGGYIFMVSHLYRLARKGYRRFMALGKDRPYDDLQLKRIEKEAK